MRYPQHCWVLYMCVCVCVCVYNINNNIDNAVPVEFNKIGTAGSNVSKKTASN